MSGARAAQLGGVTAEPRRRSSAGRSASALQRIYRVEHGRLGAIDIFLVPIAADRYGVVFT